MPQCASLSMTCPAHAASSGPIAPRPGISMSGRSRRGVRARRRGCASADAAQAIRVRRSPSRHRGADRGRACAARWQAPVAAGGPFDFQQRIEQGAWREVGLDLRHRVEKVRLRGVADGRAAVEEDCAQRCVAGSVPIAASAATNWPRGSPRLAPTPMNARGISVRRRGARGLSARGLAACGLAPRPAAPGTAVPPAGARSASRCARPVRACWNFSHHS